MKKIIVTIALLAFFLCGYAQLDNLKVEITDGINDEQLKATIQHNASEMLCAFNRAIMTGKNPKFEKGIFTKSAQEDIKKMWESSAISCPVSSISEKCLTLPVGGYQIRNIVVTLMDAPLEEQAQELVINFDQQGRIDNVMIAMEQQRYIDVLGNNISVKDFANRQMIIDFVENFRTAYNRKDIDYIDKIFSEDAIVITGKVIKVKSRGKENNMRITSEKVVYNTQNKAQYISGLKRCFKRNKYIDVTFDEIEVLKHPLSDKIYGVTLKQDWKSSTYSDTGYVFLMIDFTDEFEPCIQVRTWQPEKYNGRLINRDEIFSLDSFEINII